MKKLTTLLLLAVLLLAACERTPSESSTPESLTSESVSASETSEIKANLPEKDYDGAAFRILIRNDAGWIEDMYTEAQNGELMNDVIYARNQTISEKFDINIEAIRSSNSNYETDAVSTILANDDAYEVILPHARAAFKYAEQRLLLDWNTQLPYVDLEQPWWNQSAAENFSIAGRLFAMTGDISYKGLGSATVMLFNTDVFDALELDYPYEAVKIGEWTFDKFKELAQVGTMDLNGDGSIYYKNDRVGYLTHEWLGTIQVLYAADQRILQKDTEDLPYLTLNTPQSISAFEKFFSLIDSSSAECIRWTVQDTSLSSPDSIYGCFSSGKSMFIDTAVRDIVFLREMTSDFGLIPWPKMDTSTNGYYSNVDAGCHLFVVPITVSDPEYVSIILEALCYESYRTVIPQYIDLVVPLKLSRDTDSAEMLEIVKAGRIYDLGYYLDSTVGKLSSTGQYMFNSGARDFSSFYATLEPVANANIEEIIKVYTKE